MAVLSAGRVAAEDKALLAMEAPAVRAILREAFLKDIVLNDKSLVIKQGVKGEEEEEKKRGSGSPFYIAKAATVEKFFS